MYRVCLEMKSSTGWPCSTGVMLSHQILLPPTGWAGGCGVRVGSVVGPCGGLNITQAHIAQGAVAEQHAVSHDSCHDGAQLRSIMLGHGA